MKDMIYIISLPFKYLADGNHLEKLQASLLIALTVSPFTWLFDIVVGDLNFLAILTVGLVMDAFTGGWKHLKLKSFSIKKFFLKFVEKVLISFCFMILVNLFAQMEQFDKTPSVKDYFVLTGMLMNLVYVVGSATLNLYTISGGKFPPKSWMSRLDDFHETGEVEKLKSK